MTRTVLESKTKTVIIGFDEPFCVIGERINPTGRKKLAAELEAGDFTTVERDALSKVGEAEVKDFAEKDAVFAKVWGFNVPAVANRQATFVNTALRLFAGHPDITKLTSKLWQQQALLQIYEDFCRRDTTDCTACPFPEQIAAFAETPPHATTAD